MFGSITKKCVSALLAFSICVSPLSAGAQEQGGDKLGLGGFTPEGTWLSESRDSTYEVTLCGEDGVSLCGRLLWVREAERNAQNEAYIGKWMLYEAPRTQPAEWRGTLNIYGTNYDGAVRIISMNELTLTGCVFLVACITFSMYRTHNPDGTPVPEDQRPKGTPPPEAVQAG